MKGLPNLQGGQPTDGHQFETLLWDNGANLFSILKVLSEYVHH